MSSSSTTRRTIAIASARQREDEDKLRGEEKDEAAKNNEAARLWISGIEALKRKIGLAAVYDLSATPFFLCRLRLSRGLALSLGRERLLAARRDRMRHRQAAARPRRRQPAVGRHADLPQPLAGLEGARAQPPAQGREQGRRSRSAQARARASDCALFALFPLQADLRAVDAGHPRAAGLHRRVQQHGGVEAGLRVDFRLPAQE